MYLKTIDKVVWFIPFKKLRDKIRHKLINKYTKYYKNEKFLLNEIKDINTQKNVFKVNVKRIEIEIHSYCNRVCPFCPNSIVDRRSNLITLDENIYLNVLNALKEIDYSEVLCFHRYNEPLANKDLILKRVKQAREYLPNAVFKIYTNGDYLTREYLDELYEHGINEIVMTYYYNKKADNDDIENKIKLDMINNINKLKLKIKEEYRNTIDYGYKLEYKDMLFIYKFSDYFKLISTRGGIINNTDNIDYNVKFRCYDTFFSFNIDYTGFVTSCCELRSDIQEHNSMILGNLKENNIFQIYGSAKAGNIRKYLSEESLKEPPCIYCSKKNNIID